MLFQFRLPLFIIGLLLVCSFVQLSAGAPAETSAVAITTPAPYNETSKIVGIRPNETNETDVQVADYPKTNPVLLNVEISNRKINAGELKSQRMYDAVYKCLESMCPYDHGFCDSGKYKDTNCPIKVRQNDHSHRSNDTLHTILLD